MSSDDATQLDGQYYLDIIFNGCLDDNARLLQILFNVPKFVKQDHIKR